MQAVRATLRRTTSKLFWIRRRLRALTVAEIVNAGSSMFHYLAFQRGIAVATGLVITFSSMPLARAEPRRGTCTDDVMIVFDASGSMIHEAGAEGSQIDIARSAAHKILPAAARNRHMGLMTFGPGTSDQCSNISLKVPVQSNAAVPILAELDSITTDGGTPLSAAVEQAAEILDYKNRRAVIVVITDGDETCGRDPCEVAKNLHEKSSKLTVHVIGFKSNNGPELKSSCFADATNGMFVPSRNLEELTGALRETLVCPQVAQEAQPGKTVAR